MGDENRNKKRKSKWITWDSNMSPAQAEDRLGFRFTSLREMPVKTVLNNGNQDGELSLDEMKEEVYKEIVRYLRMEGILVVGVCCW